MEFKNWFKKTEQKIETKAVTSYSGQVTSIQAAYPETINLSNDPVRLMQFNRDDVYNANSLVSGVLASLPYHLYAVVDSGMVGKMITPHSILTKSQSKAVADTARINLQNNRKQLVEIYEHPVIDLLQTPFKGWSQYEFLYIISSYLGLIGNAYLVKHVDNAGQLVGLEPLQSEYMAIRYDRTGTITHYDYRPYGCIDSQTFTPDQILHIKNREAGSLIAGRGNLEACLQSVMVAINAEQYAAALYNNQCTPSTIFMLKNHGSIPVGEDGLPDETKIETFADRLKSKFRGSKRGDGMVSFGDMEVKQLSQTLGDSGVDIYAPLMRKKVCSAFKVPTVLMDETDSNKSIALAAQKSLKMYAVFPKVCSIFDQINAEIVRTYYDKDLMLWYDKEESLEPDQLEQMQVLTGYKNAGIYSVNECRIISGKETLGAEFDKPIAANASQAVQSQAAGINPTTQI